MVQPTGSWTASTRQAHTTSRSGPTRRHTAPRFSTFLETLNNERRDAERAAELVALRTTAATRVGDEFEKRHAPASEGGERATIDTNARYGAARIGDVPEAPRPPEKPCECETYDERRETRRQVGTGRVLDLLA